MAERYTYAVARIRAKELSLLDKQAFDRLMACGTYGECLGVLHDLGWGDGDEDSGEEILAAERSKTWELLRELVPDMGVFDVFLYPIDYNNLKAAVKSTVTGAQPEGIFLPGGTVAPELMAEAVEKNDFSPLPERMRGPAQEAYQTLLHTRDGQLCDVILDAAALSAIREAGTASDSRMIREYAEMTVAIADIKIAVRSCKTGKTAAFLKRALVPCAALDVDSLATAAVRGEGELFAYLANTPYAAAADRWKESASAFEKWCDDTVIELIKAEKSNPFTIGPLAAYLLARENEMKSVRILLSGKRNRISDGVIRERLRETYV